MELQKEGKRKLTSSRGGDGTYQVPSLAQQKGLIRALGIQENVIVFYFFNSGKGKMSLPVFMSCHGLLREGERWRRQSWGEVRGGIETLFEVSSLVTHRYTQHCKKLKKRKRH